MQAIQALKILAQWVPCITDWAWWERPSNHEWQRKLIRTQPANSPDGCERMFLED